MSKVKIGVTGTGSLIGQAVIKSIKASKQFGNSNLTGFDYFYDTIGSHWVDSSYILPDILKKDVTSEEWLEAVLKIISLEGIMLLFVGLDFELGLFAANKQLIFERTGCHVIVSNSEVINIAEDKYLTSRFLEDNGFDPPKTVLLKDADISDITYPCILKPRVGQRSRGVSVVGDSDELVKKAVEVKDPIIQELVGDSGREYTCGVIFLDGEVREIIALRRDLKEGNTINAYLEDDDSLEAIGNHVRAVAAVLKPFGACNFQLRLDRDGHPKIFEINARHSGTTYMRTLFGFNEVEYIIRCLIGEDPGKFILRKGKVKRFYDEIFIEKI